MHRVRNKNLILLEPDMEEFLPSEIARLVLGFLKENKCEKSWKIFLEECSDLYEYSLLYKRGKLYSTNVNGKSLVDILKEYCILKTASEKHNSIAKFCESVSKEKVKVILEESVKNAVEQVIQKYLPCLCRKSHHRRDLRADVTGIGHTCNHKLDKSIELENETEKLDQSNNTVILEENASKENSDCYGSSDQLNSADCDINSLTEEFISKNLRKFDGLDHNLQLAEHPVSDRIYMQDIIKVEKDRENCTFLEHKSVDDCSKNKEINSHIPSTDSEGRILLHSTDSNSVAVESFNTESTTSNQNLNTVKQCEPMQTNDCSPEEPKQTIKVEPGNSFESINQTEGSNCIQNSSSTVTHVADNHNSLEETNETAFCSIQSTRGAANNMANPINLINSQPRYAVHPFACQSLPVSNTSYQSLPTYFVQNCSSNSSILQNNSQYSFIINTPATGTATTFPLAIPGILPNNSGPTLTSVTSLSSHNPPSVLSVSNQSSSSMNVANSTNTCGKSQTDSTVVLNSVCKAAEALFVGPPKTGMNVALKSNVLTHESNQKPNNSKKGDLNKQQLCLKKKNKYENLKKQAEISSKRSLRMMNV